MPSSRVASEILYVVRLFPRRIFELSRRYLVAAKPGQPVVLPTTEAPIIPLDAVDPNPMFEKFAGLGIDPGVANRSTLDTVRTQARQQVLEYRWDAAVKQYTEQAILAADAGEFRRAADLTAEWASVLATYADENRPAALQQASAGFQLASRFYGRLGDTTAQQVMQANLRQLAVERGEPPDQNPVGPLTTDTSVPTPAGQVMLKDLIVTRAATTEFESKDLTNEGQRFARESWETIPAPVSTHSYLVPEDRIFRTSSELVTSVAARPVEKRTVGLPTTYGPVSVALEVGAYEPQVVEALYTKRIAAKTLDEIAWHEIVGTTFVAYIPHLYFYVLPLAIGDTYLALGRYQQALDEYQSALSYPYLNTELEIPDL